MTPQELRDALEAVPSFVSFFEEHVVGRVPWIFGADQNLFSEWRRDAAAALGVGPEALFIVGSAATGFSLSPLKPARAFRRVVPDQPFAYASDIDIAVVDEELFTRAWDTVLQYDRRRLLYKVFRGSLSSEGIGKIRQDIYFGCVSDAHTIIGTPPAQRLRALVSLTSRTSPFLGHRARARLYRRHEDLVSYHEQSLRQLLGALRA